MPIVHVRFSNVKTCFNGNYRGVSTKHHKWMRIARAGWTGQYVPKPLFSIASTTATGQASAGGGEDDDSGRKDRLLSGYWRIAETDRILAD